MIGCTPLGDAGVGERHRGVEAVAVGQRDGGKVEPLRLLGDRLGLDRAFEHRVAGEDAKRDVGLIYRFNMRIPFGEGSRGPPLFHN